jgi:hypothetical protein
MNLVYPLESEANGTWYCLAVKPPAFWRAKAGIEAASIPIFCPVECRQVKSRTGDQKWITVPVLMNYMFANAKPDMIGRLLRTDGVRDVIWDAENNPAPVRAGFIEEFRRHQNLVSDLAAAKQAAARMKAGDEVGIADPAFAGLIFKLASARPKDRWRLVCKNAFLGTIVVPTEKLVPIGAPDEIKKIAA